MGGGPVVSFASGVRAVSSTRSAPFLIASNSACSANRLDFSAYSFASLKFLNLYSFFALKKNSFACLYNSGASISACTSLAALIAAAVSDISWVGRSAKTEQPMIVVMAINDIAVK